MPISQQEIRDGLISGALTFSDAAREMGIKPNTIICRKVRGWSIDEIVFGKKQRRELPKAYFEIKRLREQGFSLTEISNRTGYNHGNISRICKRMGVAVNLSRNDQRTSEVCRLRREGMSVTKIADVIGITQASAYWHLKKMGLPPLPKQSKAVYSDEETVLRRLQKNARLRKWRKMNASSIAKHRLNRRNSDPMFAMKERIRALTAGAFRRAGFKKAQKTRDLLGCGWKELKSHFDNLFLEGMSWKNFGEWHIDHIIPLASAKTVDEIRALSHYKNLQPLWARDNLSKGARMP